MSILDFFRKDRQPTRTIRRQRSGSLRAYAAAAVNRLTADWNAPDTTADMEIAAALPILRQRARDLERNNDYIRRYFALLSDNVIGSNGIRLQVRAKDGPGRLDEVANTIIEDKWNKWGTFGCTVCGRYTWLDLLNLAIRSMARDGKILFYFPKTWKGNEAGFAVKIIEADHLDTRYSLDLPNGNIIRMGVEMNADRKPIAYHVLDRHPAEHQSRATTRSRLPAEDVIHLRRPERVDETRSVPWITSVAPRLKQIAAAEEAEVVAWRIAASKMGFYTSENGDNYNGDDEDENGTPISEAEPGVFETLPQGWDFKEWNPDKPASTVESFLKAELRGVASGLNVSYVSLANNLEGVSFSSIRSGEMADRGHWRTLQRLMIDHLCQPVYERWLQRSLLTGYVPLPAGKFDKFAQTRWQARGWEWVDPSNEADAAEQDVRLGVVSLFDLAAKRGNDLEEVFEANAQAKKLAEKYNLNLDVFEPKKPTVQPKVQQNGTEPRAN